MNAPELRRYLEDYQPAALLLTVATPVVIYASREPWQREYTFPARNQGPNMTEDSSDQNEKPSTTLSGTVEKVIKSPDPNLPEKAQITVEGAEDLYREIRIENVLTDENGQIVSLKPGAPVEVTIEADPEDTTKK